MDRQPIYEIHVYEYPWTKTKQGFYEHGIDECVGYYYEEQAAIDAVENNWCDIQDHYARAAMIVRKEPGLYPLIPNCDCQYYLWNKEQEKFERAQFPAQFWN